MLFERHRRCGNHRHPQGRLRRRSFGCWSSGRPHCFALTIIMAAGMEKGDGAGGDVGVRGGKMEREERGVGIYRFRKSISPFSVSCFWETFSECRPLISTQKKVTLSKKIFFF